MISHNLLFPLMIMMLTMACGQETYTRGKRIYDAYCLQCHMANGNGLGALYPALKGSDYLADRMNELPCLIRNGQQSNELATVYMPAHKSLKPVDVTNLINYMSATWGNQEVVKITDINDQINTCR